MTISSILKGIDCTLHVLGTSWKLCLPGDLHGALLAKKTQLRTVTASQMQHVPPEIQFCVAAYTLQVQLASSQIVSMSFGNQKGCML